MFFMMFKLLLFILPVIVALDNGENRLRLLKHLKEHAANMVDNVITAIKHCKLTHKEKYKEYMKLIYINKLVLMVTKQYLDIIMYDSKDKKYLELIKILADIRKLKKSISGRNKSKKVKKVKKVWKRIKKLKPKFQFDGKVRFECDILKDLNEELFQLYLKTNEYMKFIHEYRMRSPDQIELFTKLVHREKRFFKKIKAYWDKHGFDKSDPKYLELVKLLNAIAEVDDFVYGRTNVKERKKLLLILFRERKFIKMMESEGLEFFSDEIDVKYKEIKTGIVKTRPTTKDLLYNRMFNFY